MRSACRTPRAVTCPLARRLDVTVRSRTRLLSRSVDVRGACASDASREFVGRDVRSQVMGVQTVSADDYGCV